MRSFKNIGQILDTFKLKLCHLQFPPIRLYREAMHLHFFDDHYPICSKLHYCVVWHHYSAIFQATVHTKQKKKLSENSTLCSSVAWKKKVGHGENKNETAGSLRYQ